MRIELRGFKCDLTPGEEADLRAQLAAPESSVRTEHLSGMVDAATLAKKLGVSREYVYAHAEELGGEKLGSGTRGRWRFPAPAKPAPRTTTGAKAARPDPRAKASPPKRRRTSSSVELLAVRGNAPGNPSGKVAP